MFCIYVNNYRHFCDKILAREKTTETRTKRSFETMLKNGIHYGMKIGIINESRIVGYARVDGFRFYRDESDFNSDFSSHLVDGGKYGYDSKKGKVGIMLYDVERLSDPIPVGKATRPMGFRIV